jgi:hypothetical protein
MGRRCPECAEHVQPLLAALGNLSGLGFGYLALGRSGRALLALVGASAALSAAWQLAEPPFVPASIVIVWLALTAADAARIALAEPTALSRPVLAAAGGVVVFAVLLLAVPVQRARLDDSYAAALVFERDGRCEQAIDRFEAAARYRLALTRRAADANDRAEDCREFLAAGRPRTAVQRIVGYESFVSAHPASPLRPHAQERALGAYLSAGDKADQCDGAEAADRIAVDPDEYRYAGGSAVVDAAARALPELLLGCARRERENGDLEAAVDRLRRLVRDFRGHPAGRRARTELIATRVQLYLRDADTPALPQPQASGAAPVGTVLVTIENGSRQGLELLLSGPAARSVVVPVCSGCADVDGNYSADTACSSAPSRTVRLPPGGYDVVARALGDEEVNAFTGSWSLEPGYLYSRCYVIQYSFD